MKPRRTQCYSMQCELKITVSAAFPQITHWKRNRYLEHMASALHGPRKIRGIFTHRTKGCALKRFLRKKEPMVYCQKYDRPTKWIACRVQPVACMKSTEIEGYFTHTGGNDAPLGLANVLDTLYRRTFGTGTRPIWTVCISESNTSVRHTPYHSTACV